MYELYKIMCELVLYIHIHNIVLKNVNVYRFAC